MKPGSRTEKKHATSELKSSRKKKQRYKKHMGSKVEGQGFADRRKNRAIHAYNKLLQKEKGELSKWTEKVKKIYNDETEATVSSPGTSTTRKKEKVSSFHKAEGEWKKKLEEKKNKNQEFLERKRSQEAALEKYHRKKSQKHKKLSKRNYKGQPNMAGQMELLLHKIQSQGT